RSLSKQRLGYMVQFWHTLAAYCDKGLQPSRMPFLSFQAIWLMTEILDLCSIELRLLLHRVIINPQMKNFQELALVTEAKIMEYLKWIKLRGPYCPNDCPESGCRLIRKQVVGTIDFLLKNRHCDWDRFHEFLNGQQLENGHFDNGKIAEWCI